ncbi:hypothetical protein ACFOQM_14265 [Paenibacillus sp. GCM10012307]|uniref:Uncharacterized protein n=1 Tax=Paenibacillus roseus TaxID=2798579 RepID=A0A934J073_9BACL|nr:hypothetical protein [Paenibacillus roseus]MBJ6362446.1 hypothetical protein [Paenibacillus roseus]
MKKKMILSMAGMMVFGFVAGAGLMLNDQAYLSVKGVINGGGTNNAVIGSGVGSMDINSMDIETAMMMVQSNRAQLLDAQVKAQMETIQNRNKQIIELNNLILASTEAMNNIVNENCVYKSSDSVDRLYGMGVITSRKNEFKRSEIETIIQQLKGMVDAMNSSQQMDMLRLQSITNKRNESLDILTNFSKKMQDQRSSIIGNIR